LLISANGDAGIDGAWQKTIPLNGGGTYRFSIWQKSTEVTNPRRSAVVKITWQNKNGDLVQLNKEKLRPEFPAETQQDDQGWTLISDTYTLPENTSQAVVELHFRWSPTGSVRWSDLHLEKIESPSKRTARLATVHFQPRGGKTPEGNRKLFAPFIAEAAAQKADLVCLPEALTMYGNGHKYIDAAEPVPGPSTEFFGKLALEHKLYIVGGILERSENHVYNTAFLVGPEGKFIGKYRKVCLPREEIEGGVTPGDEYPVFDTRFGKLGMMICWDVHFPEVARNLSNNGAEVIAMPIWGGNPTLARARAIENQIFLVTSTYTDPGKDWMKSAIFDKEGNLLVEGTEWGKVHVAEVDLGTPKLWPWLGDFKARIHRERPANGFEN